MRDDPEVTTWRFRPPSVRFMFTLFLLLMAFAWYADQNPIRVVQAPESRCFVRLAGTWIETRTNCPPEDHQ